MDNVISSPLLYIGSKRWLFNTLLEYMPRGTKEMVTPFFGGGAVELNMALRGIRVHGYDICPHLNNFWEHWLENPIAVEDGAKHFLETKSNQEISDIKIGFDETGLEGAIWYYTCNRLSFGGQTLTDSHVRSYEKINNRFVYALYPNQTSRRKVFPFSDLWHKLPILDLAVGRLGFCESLSRHSDIFAYLDPPYVKSEYFYNDGTFDHNGLAEILHNRNKWVLSYHDCPQVRETYKGYHIIPARDRRFFTSKETTTELIILSHDIAAEVQSQPKQLYLF